MLETFQFKENCSILKRLLFFEQGDFAHALLREVLLVYKKIMVWMFTYLFFIDSEELNQPVEKIFVHRLRSQLESALLLSMSNENKEIVKRIRVRLDKKGIGWDGFRLTYYAESPLHITFTPATIHAYEQISHFLWQLKRVEYVLILNRRNYPLKVCFLFIRKFYSSTNAFLQLVITNERII